MGSWSGEAPGAVVGGPGWARQRLAEQVVPHLHSDKWEEQLGSKADRETQSASMGKQSLKTFGYKNLWGLRWWEILPASQESSLERPTWF